MTTPVEEAPPKNNTIVNKYPTYRNDFLNGCWKWIEGKRKDDNACGLWRVHDKLYDLTDFVDKHPGGKFWLEVTKGTDITEAFETHHLSSNPSKILQEYFVCDATERRNYNYTFDEHGFYKTLKRKIVEKLKKIDKSEEEKSKRIHDATLIAFIVSIIMVSQMRDSDFYLFWVILSGQLLTWLMTISLNFLHKADNWRMYSGNLALMTTRDMRVFHVLSHHMYTNTYADIEVTIYEPYFYLLPSKVKGWSYRIHSALVTIPTFLITLHNMMRMRWLGVFCGIDKNFFWDEIVMWFVPLIMIIFGGQSVTLYYLGDVYMSWLHIMLATNFFYTCNFINRGQHAPKLVHQGDEIQSFDFGEYQVSTLYDRDAVNSNIFVSLTYSGEQVLHHLFPTIDHALLPQLKGTLIETCKQFKVQLNRCSVVESVVGHVQQIYRVDINRCNNN